MIKIQVPIAFLKRFLTLSVTTLQKGQAHPNIKKTELIFRQNKNPLHPSLKFKLNCKRLFPASSVKYLGVFLNEHRYWNKHLSHATAKINQEIGIPGVKIMIFHIIG